MVAGRGQSDRMTTDLECLESDVELRFHQALPVHHLTSVMTLSRLISVCNHARASTRTVTNDMLKLLRVNLFATEFQQGAQIIKPIQVELQNFQLVVMRGDTRLMAAGLFESVFYAPVVCLVPKIWSSMFADWTVIGDWNTLTDRLDFPRGCVQVNFDRTPDTTVMSFLEFQLPQTAHHLHDQHQRRRMMTNYLSQQDPAFRFDHDWILTPVDWTQFDY